MDKSLVKGMVIGGIAVTAATAIAVTGVEVAKKPAYADVLAVNEVHETVKTPREECADVAVQRRAPVSDTHRVAGTVVGALAGGLLGSTIGGGTGRTVATVAGAAAGGYAGNTIQKNMQDGDVRTTTERRCKTVMDTSHKVVGYDVTYRLGAGEGTVRMSHRPGDRIPVKDGKLVLDEPAAG
ncbi:MAG TPA: glycine zipper 2TM domain-containing protein [Rhodocyclaceae bacterium]